MASLNTSHHQDGGVLLYSGELVLLYCDKVNCELDNVGSSNGRLFLTTHRIVFTSQPIKQNPRLMSLAAPFYAMYDLGLEQPVFGANYIRGKVRTNSSENTSALTQNQFSFKLKFNKGGACEFGRALCTAAKQASTIAQQSGWSNNYSFASTPASQYYQAPSNIYQPNYPIGFVLPNQVFNEVPQTGTIYYQTSPPPYPGLVTAHQLEQQRGPYAQVYPVANPATMGVIYEANHTAGGQYPSQYPPVPQQQPPQGYMPGSNAPPPYQPNNQSNYNANFNTNYTNQPQPPQQGSYQPASNNNAYPRHPQQYPTPPAQSGYAPQSNSTYPNIPTYDDATKKGY